MRIAYVITRSDEIGGAHVHVRDLAGWMQRRGHAVAVFVGGSGVYVDVLREAGLTVHPLRRMRRSISPLHEPAALRELAAALSEWSPDLVSAHSAKAGTLARLAARRIGVPCIFTAHGWAFADGVPWMQRQLYRRVERALAPLAGAIVTVCEEDGRLARTVGIRPAGPLRTIHNGMPDVDPSLRAAPAEGRVVRMVMTARFEPQKDHESLLSALSRLRDLPWELELIGEGMGREAVEHRTATLGLSDRVRLLGRRDDVAQILARASLFVLTSFWEGFPRSILEAMRAGLPVIASRVGGVAESVVDGVTGWTVPAGDVAAIEERLRHLIADSEARERMGAAGRERFEQRFVLESMAQRTEALYHEVLAQESEAAGR